MTPREPSRDLQSDKIRLIRPELDKRSDAEVKKAEEITRGHVDRNARDAGEKKSFLGQLFGGSK